MEVSIVTIPKKDPRNLRNSSTTSIVDNNNQPLKNRVKSAQKNNNLSVVQGSAHRRIMTSAAFISSTKVSKPSSQMMVIAKSMNLPPAEALDAP